MFLEHACKIENQPPYRCVKNIVFLCVFQNLDEKEKLVEEWTFHNPGNGDDNGKGDLILYSQLVKSEKNMNLQLNNLMEKRIKYSFQNGSKKSWHKL